MPSSQTGHPDRARVEALEFIANVETQEHRAMSAHESDAYLLGLCIGRAQAALPSSSPPAQPEMTTTEESGEPAPSDVKDIWGRF